MPTQRVGAYYMTYGQHNGLYSAVLTEHEPGCDITDVRENDIEALIVERNQDEFKSRINEQDWSYDIDYEKLRHMAQSEPVESSEEVEQ